eukprot:4902679-Amphidinium_carterae.5
MVPSTGLGVVFLPRRIASLCLCTYGRQLFRQKFDMPNCTQQTILGDDDVKVTSPHSASARPKLEKSCNTNQQKRSLSALLAGCCLFPLSSGGDCLLYFCCPSLAVAQEARHLHAAALVGHPAIVHVRLSKVTLALGQYRCSFRQVQHTFRGDVAGRHGHACPTLQWVSA